MKIGQMPWGISTEDFGCRPGRVGNVGPEDNVYFTQNNLKMGHAWLCNLHSVETPVTSIGVPLIKPLIISHHVASRLPWALSAQRRRASQAMFCPCQPCLMVSRGLSSSAQAWVEDVKRGAGRAEISLSGTSNFNFAPYWRQSRALTGLCSRINQRRIER